MIQIYYNPNETGREDTANINTKIFTHINDMGYVTGTPQSTHFTI